jgi:6-phosphogluconolactonase (cycloisomerase 2 family)
LIDQNSGNLSSIGNVAAGTQPWRAAVDPSGRFAYVGNENSGTVSIYSINRDGTLAAAGSISTLGSAFDLSVISPK